MTKIFFPTLAVLCLTASAIAPIVARAADPPDAGSPTGNTAAATAPQTDAPPKPTKPKHQKAAKKPHHRAPVSTKGPCPESPQQNPLAGLGCTPR
jgi:hypothetical protein